MQKLIFSLLGLFLYAGAPKAQNALFFCNHSGEMAPIQLIEKPIADPDADGLPLQSAIESVLELTGLEQNFSALPDDRVKTICAVETDGDRYLLYNEAMLPLLDAKDRTAWTLLAHAIGHHLNLHDAESPGTRAEKELQADEFAGFVLGRMGASLAEAQQALVALPGEASNKNYPQKKLRIEAAAAGWAKANPAAAGPSPAKIESKARPERQKVFARMAKQETVLQMPEGRGRNGAGVAYHAAEDVYYAVFAGNTEFPLARFTPSGTLLSAKTAGVDARGMWYNPAGKSLEFNTYGGDYQPDPQVVGAYDPTDKKIYYWDGEFLYRYNAESRKQEKKISIDYKDRSDLNTTTVVYTGFAGQELGLLNVLQKRLILFNKSSGSYTGYIQLPDDAPVSLQFNTAFTNNKVWIFDLDLRRWIGYGGYTAP